MSEGKFVNLGCLVKYVDTLKASSIKVVINDAIEKSPNDDKKCIKNKD